MRAAHRSSVFAGPRAAQSTITSLVMAMLLAWTPGRLEAEVIDDFDGARKYSVHGEGAVPEIEVVDGQLKSSRLRDGGFIGIYYPRNYLIPEGRPIEFRLDVLHLNADSAYAAVVVEFPPHRLVADTRTWFHYYGLYWQHTHLYLIRQSPTGEMRLVDATLPRVTVPVTITLSLSRNGTAMELRALVVQRDNPAEVVFDRAVTDRGAPFPDPVEMVTVGIGDTDASGGRTECIVDNLVCSDDAVSLPLGVQRTANGGVTLGWQGHRVPLEADSVQGPWTPVLEPITIGTAARSLLLVPGRERRFFQLVPGWQAADFFNDNTYGWQTAATVPGRVWKPLLGLSGGRARILGEGLHNEEFLLRFPMDVGMCHRDCAASVDIVDWDDTMEDAAFGILLRVKPQGELWNCGTEGLPTRHYGGLLTFKTRGNPAESALTITGPGDIQFVVRRFAAVNPEKPYRLRFQALGSRLTLELFDLDNLAAPVATCQRVDSQVPEGMSALYGAPSRAATGKYDVTIDRFVLTGTTPW